MVLEPRASDNAGESVGNGVLGLFEAEYHVSVLQ